MTQDNPNRILDSILEKLIETCKDGEKGYRDAAEHVKSSELKTFFHEQSSERGRFAQELQLPSLGSETKKESGSVTATLHRTWIDVKANLGGGDKAILSSVEQGEDNAKATYEKALAGSLPSQLVDVVRRQAEKIKSAHDK